MSKYQVYIDELRKENPSLPDTISHLSNEAIDEYIVKLKHDSTITDSIQELLILEASIRKYGAEKTFEIIKQVVIKMSGVDRWNQVLSLMQK